MKQTLVFITALICTHLLSAQIYLAKESEISFFSATPMENISAINKAAKPILNTATGDVQVKIVMQAFQFEKPLMQEHFNENYVESDKYPDAIYKGKINEQVDYLKDGTTKVTVAGKLKMHGVEKECNFGGTVTVKGQQILLETKFKIHIADYNIKIPSLVVKNIAEDIDVTVNALLEPFKK
ncbi:MAG: YceI family protein [Bacteroidia bacterium]|nr:YceI family protein [Bacteroidia bacterium]